MGQQPYVMRRRHATALVLLGLLLANCSAPPANAPASADISRPAAPRVQAPTAPPRLQAPAAPRPRPSNTFSSPDPRPSVGQQNTYAATGAGMMSPGMSGEPYRLYVPDSGTRSIEVIDPIAKTVVATYRTGLNPQHVVPAWDLSTLYATNDLANTITPIDPRTAAPTGSSIAVDDPYNLYFTPDGSAAIVVAEAKKNLDFRDPHTYRLLDRLQLDCSGVDHLDFSADGTYLVASCEFAAKLVKVDVQSRQVIGYLSLPKSSPQDVKLDDAGTTFYVADKFLGGVHLIDAASFRETAFIPTGKDAHGLYPSRDGKLVYVSNRGSGSVSVIDFASRKAIATWLIPGGSPDMGGVSPDGKTLWLTGRYDKEIYGLDTTTGTLITRIPVGSGPHGMLVWPQPGRYSLGHTGNMR